MAAADTKQRTVTNGTYLNWSKTTTKPYLRITAGPQRGQYVHRLVAQAKLGRPLLPDEDVHHIDGDTLNNDPENITGLKRDAHGCVTRLMHRERKRQCRNQWS